MNSKQIPRWLSGFYNKVQMLLAAEYKYAGAVFGTNRAASVFLSFVNEAMRPIEVREQQRWERNFLASYFV